jgi:hypothetical protein
MRPLVLALALIGLTACRAAPAGSYRSGRFHFEHLAGWSVVKDSPLAGRPAVRVINVEGPHHASLSVFSFPGDQRVDVARFAAEVATRRDAIGAKKLEVAGVSLGSMGATEQEDAEARVAGEVIHGLAQHFYVELVGVKVPHRATFFARALGGRTLLLMSQVSDEHAVLVQEGFQRIYDTLAVSD